MLAERRAIEGLLRQGAGRLSAPVQTDQHPIALPLEGTGREVRLRQHLRQVLQHRLRTFPPTDATQVDRSKVAVYVDAEPCAVALETFAHLSGVEAGRALIEHTARQQGQPLVAPVTCAARIEYQAHVDHGQLVRLDEIRARAFVRPPMLDVGRRLGRPRKRRC